MRKPVNKTEFFFIKLCIRSARFEKEREKKQKEKIAISFQSPRCFPSSESLSHGSPFIYTVTTSICLFYTPLHSLGWVISDTNQNTPSLYSDASPLTHAHARTHTHAHKRIKTGSYVSLYRRSSLHCFGEEDDTELIQAQSRNQTPRIESHILVDLQGGSDWWSVVVTSVPPSRQPLLKQ